MNYSKLSVAAMLAVAAMSSCTNDSELNSAKSEYVNTVRVSVEDFQPEAPSTRTAYTVDASGFHFQWTSGDALGIYPVGGDQVKFPISSGDGAATASFDGGAWKLRSEYQYAAYYPFSDDNYKIPQTALPVSFEGQTQNGDKSTAHLSQYDYLACAATSPDADGGVNLTMKHLGAFVRLQLTMPENATLQSADIKSDGAQFTTKGTFDLTAATPAIAPSVTSSTLSLQLQSISYTKGDVATLYCMVAPADLSAANLTITVVASNGKKYDYKTVGRNFQAGMSYDFTITTSAEAPVDNNGHAYVDLGLPSGLKWATMNIGATTPEDYGGYYAWGETVTKTSYTKENYSHFHIRTGTDADGFDIEEPVWDLSNNISGTKYDVAHVKWGGSWRMPTPNEFGELTRCCTWTWGTKNSVYGYKVTGPNGNWIFLPVGGYLGDGGSRGDETGGHYWTSTFGGGEELTSDTANTQSFWSNANYGTSYDRFLGLSVRAVCQ